MKLLLDENLPGKLKNDFVGFEAYTVRDMNWNGISNGKLLSLMIENSFDVLLTFDKNLQHQQNFEKYPVAVILLTAPSNQYKYLSPLVDQIKTKLGNLKIGISIVGK